MFQPNIHHINHNSNFRKPKEDNNYVIHSKVKAFEKQDHNSSLSIKLVLNGTERYRLNNKRYDLSPGEFLVVDQQQELQISFNEKQVAEGMCFYFDRKYINQLFAIATKGECWALDNYSSTDKAYELVSTKFRTQESSFGQHLTKAAHYILQNEESFIADDFFLDIANCLIDQQKSVFTKVNRLKSTKLSTRKELFDRVLLAKYYIEDHINETITIEEIAAAVALSEVQLHRAFKQIFQITPYQYILTTKLNRAATLLRKGQQSISDISLSLGFIDLPTFSKAFKRKFGVTPKAFV